jgi:4-diphosphocytidyl-2-C-methyl-D-erythritol kinase
VTVYNRRPAPAKVNLALVVGPQRGDGKHEVATVLQRLDLCDRVRVERAPALRVRGFDADTLVHRALASLAAAAGVEPLWEATIEKAIPVAAGLGGGSSDAASALLLANALLDEPLELDRLHAIAAALGADVPFFLRPGPQLGEGDGSELTPLDLPQDYWVVLVHPHGATKPSTTAVYGAFDERGGEQGFPERRVELARALAGVRRPRDLAALPPNDLARSPLAGDLLDAGAFRADVSGAGPVVYGLFLHRNAADAARHALRSRGRTWIAVPAWYG